ncbi:MAG: hypothetical protein LIP01_09020 [Tannerellaceae bacterium]|nr:hypothetical protein [Tannerellaceae bacterium]
MTDAYDAYKEKSGIRVLESADIYPLEINEKEKLFQKEVPEDIQRKIDRAYAVHYFWGNW